MGIKINFLRILTLLTVGCLIRLPAFGQALPIKSNRTISIETTEGSYMDVDLSPDGKTIVFTLLGEIFQMPAAGGDAKQLTRALAINFHPVWSPDGQAVAYISDISGTRRLQVMHADGASQRTLDPNGQQFHNQDFGVPPMPVWGLNGASLAIEDRLISLAGGSKKLPKDVINIFDTSLDGRLYYQVDHGTENYIESYDRLIGKATKLADLPSQTYNPRISPDGKWLTYIQNPSLKSSLMLRDLASGKEKVLIDQLEPDYREIKEHYAFSSDSKYLLIGYNGKIHKVSLDAGDDTIIPFKARLNIDCAKFNYHTYRLSLDSLKVRYTRWANESPDGKRLIFQALNKVYIMDLPNGKPRLLVNQALDQLQPAFSPDGKWIIYVTKSDTKGMAVWRICASGCNPEQLTNDKKPMIYTNPTWSTDGTRIAVLKDSVDISDTYRVTESSLGSLQLLNVHDKSMSAVKDGVPMLNLLKFSADDKRIIYQPSRYIKTEGGMISSPSSIKNALEAVDLDGRNTQLLATMSKKSIEQLVEPANEGASFWQVSMSPDKRYVVYEINEDLYLSPVAFPADTILINSAKGVQPVIRFAIGGLDPRWSSDGGILSWSYGNKFYKINPDDILRAAIAQNDTARDDKNEQPIKVRIRPNTVNINLKAFRNYAIGTIALTNVRIISMKGDEVIESGTVIIRNGRFLAEGKVSKIKIPKSAKIIDLRGKTVMPGIIDVHDHMGAFRVITGQQFSRFLSTLAYGVTTARDPSSSYDSFGSAECLEIGQMIGPRLFTVGVCVNNKLKSYEEALATVQKRTELGATYVKQYEQETRVQRQWLAKASQNYGLDMTNEGGSEFIEDIAMIKDGSTGIEHGPYWGDVHEDVIQLWALSGAWHTPTLSVARTGGGDALAFYRYQLQLHPDYKVFRFQPEKEYQKFLHNSIPKNKDTIPMGFLYPSIVEARIFHYGGHVALGGHGNDPGIGSHHELWALKLGGLTSLEALQEATIDGAKALGMQQDLGSIEPGKLADLIILDKNPLDDIHNSTSIRYVMKNGILYDGNTLNEVWPEKKKLPEWRYKGTQPPNNDKEQKHQKLNQNSADDDDNE